MTKGKQPNPQTRLARKKTKLKVTHGQQSPCITHGPTDNDHEYDKANEQR